MKNNKTIAIDADGVILDFLKQWEVAAMKLFGRTIERQTSEYDLAVRYGMSHEDKSKLWRFFHEDGHWASIPALPGAVEAVHALLEANYDVHVVTSITSDILESRKTNFRKIGLIDIPVHCVDGRKYGKLLDLKPLMFVDDNPLHIEEAHAAGVPRIIHVPNHHEDHHHPLATRHCLSLKEAVDLMLSNEIEPAKSLAAKPAPHIF